MASSKVIFYIGEPQNPLPQCMNTGKYDKYDTTVKINRVVRETHKNQSENVNYNSFWTEYLELFLKCITFNAN